LTVSILFTIALALGATTLTPITAAASPDEPAPTPTTVPITVPITVPGDVTIDTANPFLPDDVDLSLCVGTLPRPGCGSEERGGWHQNLVAIAMVVGLLIVFGRVAWGVVRSQRRNTIDEQTAAPGTPAPDLPTPDLPTSDVPTPDDGADLTTSP
jgi:hypothetical protein